MEKEKINKFMELVEGHREICQLRNYHGFIHYVQMKPTTKNQTSGASGLREMTIDDNAYRCPGADSPAEIIYNPQWFYIGYKGGRRTTLHKPGHERDTWLIRIQRGEPYDPIDHIFSTLEHAAAWWFSAAEEVKLETMGFILMSP